MLNELINIQHIKKDNVDKSFDFLKEAKKSVYFWKNNPENNEKYLRSQLNAPSNQNQTELRTMLGVQNGLEWIQNFNIGQIMHLQPVFYQDFSFCGDIIYEISNNMLLEKVIYLSICYFTFATEIRFIENEKNKKANKKLHDIVSEQQKSSESFHLKSIEIVCKFITCKSPFINHLIASYQRHYNQNLEVIQEESFVSHKESILQREQQYQDKQSFEQYLKELENKMQLLHEEAKTQELLKEKKPRSKSCKNQLKNSKIIVANKSPKHSSIRQSTSQNTQQILKKNPQKQWNFIPLDKKNVNQLKSKYLINNNNNNQKDKNKKVVNYIGQLQINKFYNYGKKNTSPNKKSPFLQMYTQREKAVDRQATSREKDFLYKQDSNLTERKRVCKLNKKF